MRRMFLAAKCEARLHGKMKTTKKLTSTENHILQKKKKKINNNFTKLVGKALSLAQKWCITVSCEFLRSN